MTQNRQEEIRKTDKKSIVNIPKTGYNERQEDTVTEESIKAFKELDLNDNFMFTKVMTNPKLYKELLEAILGVEIERIVYSEKKYTLDEKTDAKGVYLDVYMKGGRHIYTFKNRCIQASDIILSDETTKIFLNPQSDMDDSSPKLANFLKFLTDGKPVDEYTERLMKAVEAARNNKMWEVEYKAYYANMQDKYNMRLVKGQAEGRADGLTALVTTLKSVLKDFDKVYEAVQNNEIYADVTKEKVLEYYQKCP